MRLKQKIDTGVYIIAEMSANHAGSLGNALEIVRAAKKSGADCLKIQTYTADTMTINCDNDCFKINGGLWDGYRLYDLYKQAYTPWEWHKAIKDECDAVGIDFLSTPFDKTAVDFLEELEVGFYKIASFELVDIPLIEYTASKRKPMIISCGMGDIDEIQDTVDVCLRAGLTKQDLILLKCCSAYPANYEDMNIATMRDMAIRFGVRVGLSDHSMGSLAPVVAVSLGACVIEKHFCLSREIENPDASFSMEPNEFKQMVEDIRMAEKAVGQVSYRLSAKENESKVFRRSIFAVKDIKKGERLTQDNIKIIRPGFGLAPKYYNDVINKQVLSDIKRGTPLTFDVIGVE